MFIIKLLYTWFFLYLFHFYLFHFHLFHFHLYIKYYSIMFNVQFFITNKYISKENKAGRHNSFKIQILHMLRIHQLSQFNIINYIHLKFKSFLFSMPYLKLIFLHYCLISEILLNQLSITYWSHNSYNDYLTLKSIFIHFHTTVIVFINNCYFLLIFKY